jgi:putative DNA primase/helicase
MISNPIALYLRGRGLSLPLSSLANLRFHPALCHPVTKKNHFAMVAAFRDVNDNGQAIHRTYLTPEGQKLTGDGVTAKLMLGSSYGCAIRLAPVSDKMALTEGIENALSVMQLYGWPCWATGSASNLAAVILPDTIREVIICADNEPTGIAAAQDAARRFIAEGRQAKIRIPPDGCKDFNDYLMTKKAAV